MSVPLTNIYSISVPREITVVMVKVKAHRLVDGDIVTITGCIIDKTVKIVENEDKILIVVYKTVK